MSIIHEALKKAEREREVRPRWLPLFGGVRTARQRWRPGAISGMLLGLGTLGAAGLCQAHAIGGILRQAAREHAPGGPGADDDVVELAVELGCRSTRGGRKCRSALGQRAVSLRRQRRSIAAG